MLDEKFIEETMKGMIEDLDSDVELFDNCRYHKNWEEAIKYAQRIYDAAIAIAVFDQVLHPEKYM